MTVVIVRKLDLHEGFTRWHNDSMKMIALLVICFAFLNQGRLETVDFTWVDYHPASDLPYVHVEGAVFNSGSSRARNVQLITRIYDSNGTLLQTQITGLGDIPARAYTEVSIDVRHAGRAYKCEVALVWKPFGG
jgi:hypothetical protein